MREILIEGASFSSAEDVHAFLARELDFPSYYGSNLDALNDCLSDIDEKTSFSFFMADECPDGEEATSFAEFFPKVIRSAFRAARENESIEVLVHAASLDAIKRLIDCRGLLELAQDDSIITQAVIAKI